ncbi:MAG: PorT family protein [Bacteroidales bacterium]|nr:PorT family protein [Bacteroidales bacterium]
MKKILAIAALFASMAVASAQQFGVMGGLTLSSMNGSQKNEDSKTMTLYGAGVLYKADLGAGFAVQPALSYQVKGASINQGNDIVTTSKTGFAELSVGLQWGPDLLAFRPYLFVEPYVGYGVTGSEKVGWSSLSEDLLKKYATALNEAKNKLEYGVGAGIGLEIASHIQLSCQLFRSFGPLYNSDKLEVDALKNVKSYYGGLKNYQGVKLNLAILF